MNWDVPQLVRRIYDNELVYVLSWSLHDRILRLTINDPVSESKKRLKTITWLDLEYEQALAEIEYITSTWPNILMEKAL